MINVSFVDYLLFALTVCFCSISFTLMNIASVLSVQKDVIQKALKHLSVVFRGFECLIMAARYFKVTSLS